MDGDTIRLQSGENARLLGVDAFERRQVARLPNNALLPIGERATSFLDARAAPNAQLAFTGDQSFSRPVVTLGDVSGDVGRSILREGWGEAAPDYLRNDPTRLGSYMEAERLARLNRLGAHDGRFETPAEYRSGEGPWKAAEPAHFGEGEAVFWDEPTPFQGLRPEIAEGYLALAERPGSTAADLLAYAQEKGFQIDPAAAEKFIRERDSGAEVNRVVEYAALPQALTNPGDGVGGAFARGLGDPINVLDELGGIVDTLGGTDGRESIWNSDRRFGDVLWNNIDQNRSILDYDDANHPIARFGGQLASGLALPGASVQGVGFNAGRAALRSGASRFAADTAARSAVRGRLMRVGAVEGGLAGAGSGEGGLIDRAPGAALGATVGAVAGPALEVGATGVRQGLRWVRDRVTGKPRLEPDTLDASLARTAKEGAKAETDEVSVPPPPDGFVMDMAADIDVPTLDGPRVVDRIDVGDIPPPPPGFTLDEPSLSRRPAPVMEQPSPEAIADKARTIRPGDVQPIPSNMVESADEAAAIGEGMRPRLQAPDERQMLPPYRLGERTRRNPMDLIGFLRASGGMRPHSELNALGIGNAARDLEFARDEGFLGPMVRDEGMSLEEAAEVAWERGYFPDRDEPPSIVEFLDALDVTNRGLGGRVFHPDDFEALDAYRAAQQERFRIEEAEQEGAPLHDDIGRPVTLDDLDAMEPPATAYEDLPSVGGRVANVNLANVETRGDIRRLLQATETRFGGFDAARRGKITHAETAALASELGMTADDLIKRRKGQALNAEQALAARQLLAKSSDEILTLAAKVDGGSDADVSAFQAAMVRHAAIYEQVTAATAEAGRTLAQFRIAARSREATAGRIHKAMLEGSGGRDQIEDVAAKILELQKLGATPGQVNKFAVKATKPKFSDKLVELWYNSLLSGPQTHVVNTVSNAMTAGLQIPEQLAASALGQFRRRSVDRVLASEIGPRVVGLTQGVREGLREFARTLRTGEVRDHVTKVEARTQRAISGVKGEVIRIPTRLLAAEDELFKAMARRMEISGLAVRKARAEGLTGDALRNRIAELTANPTDEMFERSLDYARYLTYQRPLGPVGNAVSAITKNAPVLKLFLPFVRTPTNIFKFVIERSPAAPILREVRADLAAGGARRDLAAARMLLGTGFAMLISEMAADGRITGSGPLDDNAKSIKRAEGWQPYSIRIGDQWISYQRLDPIATTMGVAADLVEKQSVMTAKQAENAAGLLIASIIKNLGDKTWFSGLSDLTAALDDPERSLTRVAGRVAGSAAVPALVAQTTRTADPVLREARTILDNVKSRVPGLSQTLPAKRDIWGEAIVREGGIGPDFMSPMWTSTARNDPLNAEMLRLGARFGAPSRIVGGRELTGHEYSNYLATSGQMTRNALAPLIASPEWGVMDRDAQTKLVDRIKSDSRKTARRGLFGASRKAAPPPPPPGFSIDPPPAGYVLD